MSRFNPVREPDARQPNAAQPPRENRQIYTTRDHFPGFDEREVKALKAVGAFRMVNARDVPGINLDKLIRSGLMERRTIYQPRGGERVEVLSLTKKGQGSLRSQQSNSDPQRYWAGMVKPNEIEHDLAIYPAYQKEAEEIRKAGGNIRRVVLDYEFKSEVNRRMNRVEGPTKEQRRKELAEEYELPIIDGKLALPDLRIEYTDAEGREDHRDIEIVTRHYRGSHRAGKAQSDFRLHNANGSRASVNDDHHLSFL